VGDIEFQVPCATVCRRLLSLGLVLLVAACGLCWSADGDQFAIGSVTKSLVAAQKMQLVEASRLSRHHGATGGAV
jgi:hypothetical protein